MWHRPWHPGAFFSNGGDMKAERRSWPRKIEAFDAARKGFEIREVEVGE